MTTHPVRPVSGKRMSLYELVESQGYLSLSSMEGLADFGQPMTIEGSRWKVVPGVALAVLVVILAYGLQKAPFPPFTVDSQTMPHPLGVSILAIVLGIVVSSLYSLPKGLVLGCKWAAAWLIPIAIVLLGAKMHFSALANVGVELIAIMVALMAGVIGLALGLGKWFGLSRKMSYLLGVGTAICGSSAILAVAPVTQADEDDVVLSVGAVNVIGLVAMFSCVGVLIGFPAFSAELYGAWAGASIHAVPQVVAAGASHGEEAASIATMVKLARVSLLAPVVLLSVLWMSRMALASGGEKVSAPKKLYQYVPWFVWGFAGLALVASFQLLPDLEFQHLNDGPVKVSLGEICSRSSSFLLTVAMAAIGLQVKMKSMLGTGAKVLVVCLLCWLVFSALALAMFHFIL